MPLKGMNGGGKNDLKRPGLLIWSSSDIDLIDAIHLLTYDIGTTGAKTCLFRLGKTLELRAIKGRFKFFLNLVHYFVQALGDGGRGVGHPVAINPTKQLAACANERGWPLYRF